MAPSLLERYIDAYRQNYDAIRERYGSKVGKSKSFFEEELKRVFLPSLELGIIKYREMKRSSYRPSGDNDQFSYSFSIKLNNNAWHNLDTGKRSEQREFELFVRKILIARHGHEIREFAMARAPRRKEVETQSNDFLLGSCWMASHE